MSHAAGFVLVAGGTGHTGERLARALARRGHAVRVMSRRGADHPVLAALAAEGIATVPGDFREPDTVAEALHGARALVSCAHIRHAPAAIAACGRASVARYLQMSSTRRFTQFPCTSSREVIAGEQAITTSGLVYTILRPTMIFGGRRDANMQRLVEWFQRRRWLPLPGGGDNLVQPVFVEDLVAAMVAALEREAAAAGRAYTIAGPEAITLRELFTATCRAVRGHDPLLIPIPLRPALWAARLMPAALQRRTLHPEQIQRFLEDKTADITEARRDLDFTPRPFAEAIRLKVAGLDPA